MLDEKDSDEKRLQRELTSARGECGRLRGIKRMMQARRVSPVPEDENLPSTPAGCRSSVDMLRRSMLTGRSESAFRISRSRSRCSSDSSDTESSLHRSVSELGDDALDLSGSWGSPAKPQLDLPAKLGSWGSPARQLPPVHFSASGSGLLRERPGSSTNVICAWQDPSVLLPHRQKPQPPPLLDGDRKSTPPVVGPQAVSLAPAEPPHGQPVVPIAVKGSVLKDMLDLPSPTIADARFSSRVFRRVLEQVDRCSRSTLAIIAFDECVGGITTGPPLRPEMQALWKKLKLSVFDDLPSESLDHWSIGAVVVQPVTGVITAITVPVVHGRSDNFNLSHLGDSRINVALAVTRSCSCVAIYKKAPIAGKEHSLFVLSSPHVQRDMPEVMQVVDLSGICLKTEVLDRIHPPSQRQNPDPSIFTRLGNETREVLPFEGELPPEHIAVDVYRAAIRLSRQYQRGGVEGIVKGHTLTIGCPQDIESLGSVRGLNDFRHPHDVRITSPSGAEDVRRRMNMDGMTVIDGRTGQPCYNNFFLHNLSKNGDGGARSASALGVAEQAMSGVAVIKISEDNGIKVFLGIGGDVQQSSLGT